MRRWKTITLATVGAIVALSWIALFAMIVIGVDAVGMKAWIAVVTFTAAVTEVGFWICAAILGLSIVQARKRVWQWLTSPLRRPKAS